MKAIAGTWANGSAAIDFPDYAYTGEWFFSTLQWLEAHTALEAMSLPVFGLDSTTIELSDGTINAIFLMDNYTASISFSDPSARDHTLARLLSGNA